MSLLKKLNIQDGEHSNNYEDVAVPELGEGVEIRVQKLRIDGQFRLTSLQSELDSLKIKDEKKLTALRTTAMLMCCMVDENGDYLAPGNDVQKVMNYLDSTGVFFKLFAASNRVNKVNELVEELEDSKKNS